jgi:tRNA A37 methylthiotransferase MiaB
MSATPPKIGFVSLGCPKALVDSERIITKLRAEGYELSPSYEGADAVVVNTCGFLNSAKEESLEAIGEALGKLEDHVPEEIKAERYARLMERQQAISADLLASRVGKTIEVIVDEVDDEGAIARSHWDAPEIDGNVYLNGETELKPGDRVMVRVEVSDDYDLWADQVGSQAERETVGASA